MLTKPKLTPVIAAQEEKLQESLLISHFPAVGKVVRRHLLRSRSYRNTTGLCVYYFFPEISIVKKIGLLYVTAILS